MIKVAETSNKEPGFFKSIYESAIKPAVNAIPTSMQDLKGYKTGFSIVFGLNKNKKYSTNANSTINNNLKDARQRHQQLLNARKNNPAATVSQKAVQDAEISQSAKTIQDLEQEQQTRRLQSDLIAPVQGAVKAIPTSAQDFRNIKEGIRIRNPENYGIDLHKNSIQQHKRNIQYNYYRAKANLEALRRSGTASNQELTAAVNQAHKYQDQLRSLTQRYKKHQTHKIFRDNMWDSYQAAGRNLSEWVLFGEADERSKQRRAQIYANKQNRGNVFTDMYGQDNADLYNTNASLTEASANAAASAAQVAVLNAAGKVVSATAQKVSPLVDKMAVKKLPSLIEKKNKIASQLQVAKKSGDTKLIANLQNQHDKITKDIIDIQKNVGNVLARQQKTLADNLVKGDAKAIVQTGNRIKQLRESTTNLTQGSGAAKTRATLYPQHKAAFDSIEMLDNQIQSTVKRIKQAVQRGDTKALKDAQLKLDALSKIRQAQARTLPATGALQKGVASIDTTGNILQRTNATYGKEGFKQGVNELGKQLFARSAQRLAGNMAGDFIDATALHYLKNATPQQRQQYMQIVSQMSNAVRKSTWGTFGNIHPQYNIRMPFRFGLPIGILRQALSNDYKHGFTADQIAHKPLRALYTSDIKKPSDINSFNVMTRQKRRSPYQYLWDGIQGSNAVLYSTTTPFLNDMPYKPLPTLQDINPDGKNTAIFTKGLRDVYKNLTENTQVLSVDIELSDGRIIKAGTPVKLTPQEALYVMSNQGAFDRTAKKTKFVALLSKPQENTRYKTQPQKQIQDPKQKEQLKSQNQTNSSFIAGMPTLALLLSGMSLFANNGQQEEKNTQKSQYQKQLDAAMRQANR